MDTFLSIIAVTYNHGPALSVFLNSLICQTSRDWELILLHDGPADDDTVSRYTQFESDWTKRPSRGLSFVQTPKRTNKFGHDLRGQGLKLARGQFIHFENADNYCVPELVEIAAEVQKEADYDFVCWNQVHNYAGTCFGKGKYSVLDTQIKLNHIDMAAFIVRAEMAMSVGFPFTNFAADWEFIKKVFVTFPDIKYAKTNAVLNVHN